MRFASAASRSLIGLRTGAGWAVTLRPTSPQAPSVVIMVWLISAIVAFRSPLMTPWNWIACRVVMRNVWFARWPARSSRSRFGRQDHPDQDIAVLSDVRLEYGHGP